MIPLTVHPSHRCAVAHANRLTPDSLLARTWVHGAGPPRCRVANQPFSSMRYGDRRGWGGAWYVPCKTPRQQRQGRRMPPQDDLPNRAVRHDGRHGSSGGGAIRRRGQRRGVNPHGAQRWSAACWGRWHRSALYRWRGRADDRSRPTQYRAAWDDLSGALRLVQSACHGAAAVSVPRRGHPVRAATSRWAGGPVSPSGARRTAVRADGCAAHCPF